AVGERLVSWGADRAILFWSAAGERLPGGDDHAHSGGVGGVLAVGERLVSWGYDGEIRFWSAAGERLPGGDDHAHASSVYGVLAVGERLASWGEDRFVKFWSRAGEPLVCWIQPDVVESNVTTCSGKLFLLHPSGPREFIIRA